MKNESKTIARIHELVRAELPMLSTQLRTWAKEHLVVPRQVELSLDPDVMRLVTLWLVTDHVGAGDSSHRVVHDVQQERFGLEVTTNTGIHWYMGPYGGFAETIESL